MPDTEDEEESSFVEGPKPTEKEQDEIGEEVDKALVENFEQCEKAVQDRKKTDGEKTEANDEKAEANGEKAEANGEKAEANGEAMDTEVKSDSWFLF